MTAFARLWQRAPIWRIALCIAVVSALAGGLFLRGQSIAGGVATTYRTPTLADLLTKSQTGIIEAAGRQIPLPIGPWYEVISSTEHGRTVVDSSLWMHMSDGRPNAFISILAIEANPSGPQLHLSYRCASAGDLAHAAPPLSGDTQFECWNLRRRSLPSGWQEPEEGLIYHLSLQRLAELGVVPSGNFLETNWVRSDPGGAILVSYLMPDKTIPARQMPTARQIAAMTLSTNRWVQRLESGADDNLSLAESEAFARRWPAPAGSAP